MVLAAVEARGGLQLFLAQLTAPSRNFASLRQHRRLRTRRPRAVAADLETQIETLRWLLVGGGTAERDTSTTPRRRRRPRRQRRRCRSRRRRRQPRGTAAELRHGRCTAPPWRPRRAPRRARRTAEAAPPAPGAPRPVQVYGLRRLAALTDEPSAHGAANALVLIRNSLLSPAPRPRSGLAAAAAAGRGLAGQHSSAERR